MQLTYEEFIRANFENAITLAKTIERELGKEKAHEIIYQSRVEGDIASARAQVNDKPIQTFAEFKSLMRKLHENRVARNLFEITLPVDDDREVEFRTTRCVLASVFRDMGEQQLGYLMCCKPDHDSTPAFCPRVSLRRTKTLMIGDPYCDTTYVWT